MDQARFFEAGDNLNHPAGGGSHPFKEGLRIAGVAQCAGCDHADWVAYYLLCGPMKTAQHLDCFGHRLGREKPRTKHAFAQPSDLTIFVDRVKTAARKPSDFQSDGVGADINRGKGWHEARPTVYMPRAGRSSRR